MTVSAHHPGLRIMYRFQSRHSLAFLLIFCAPAVWAQAGRGEDPIKTEVRRCGQMLSSDPGAALRIAESLLPRTDLPTETQIQLTACLGISQAMLGQGGNAASSAERLLQLAATPGLPDQPIMFARLQAGDILTQTGQLQKALDLYDSIQVDAIATGDIIAQQRSLAAVGILHASLLDDPEGALPYFKHLLEITERLKQPPTATDGLTYYNYGYALLLLRRYDEADGMFDRAAVTLNAVAGQQVLLRRIDSHRAEILRAQGKFEAAASRFQQVAGQQHAQGDSQGEVVTLQRLARTRLQQERGADALVLAQQAQEMAERGGYPPERRHGLDLLADIHAALGHVDQAMRLVQQGRDIDRANARDGALDRLASMQARSVHTDADRVETLLQGARDRLLRNAAIAVAAVLALAGVATALLYRRRQRRLMALCTLDPLTGLLNQREFDRQVQALRPIEGGPGQHAILAIELDTLTAVNAAHGRDAGDRLLKAVARCLQAACDRHDLLSRPSAGRFMIARPDTTAEAVFALADHLCRQVRQLQVEDGGGQVLAATLTIGVAPLPLFPTTPPCWRDSISVAERARTVARRSGTDGWAGLWGKAAGAAGGCDGARLLDDVDHALAQGWVTVAGDRPMSWSRRQDAAPETGPRVRHA